MINKVSGKSRVGWQSLLFVSSGFSALSASATVPYSPAISGSPLAPTGLAGVIQVIFSLGVVLAAIFITLWLIKRLNGSMAGGSQRLKVISGAMVGPKERVVIVEVENKWLVLGVTSSEVGLLHTLDRPEQAPAVDEPKIPFAIKLGQALRNVQIRRDSPEKEVS